MWLFFVPATARHVFDATDPQSALYTPGIEWGGAVFAFYSITCFIVALALPRMAALTTRKTVHAFARICGAVGLLSVYLIHSRWLLILSMVGVGIAWASILSMPYAILSTALPPARMGVYMGVFNFLHRHSGDRRRAGLWAVDPHGIRREQRQRAALCRDHGGRVSAAATLVVVVQDVGERDVPERAVIAGDSQERLLAQPGAQPVAPLERIANLENSIGQPDRAWRDRTAT